MQRKPWEQNPNYTWEDPANLGGYGGYSPNDTQPPSAQTNPSQALAKPSAITPEKAESSPYLDAAGLGLKGLGTVLNAYGAYKQSEQADRDYELQKEAFEFDKGLSLQDRAISEEERRRRAALEAGGYAGDYLQQARMNYGKYNAMRGA